MFIARSERITRKACLRALCETRLYADKRFALLSIGHEPIMLLLHQSAFLYITIYFALLAKALSNCL